MVNAMSLDISDIGVNISAVAKNLFEDGTTNWGRIVSLVAFGVVVSRYLKEKSRENCVELVAEEIATYLLTDQKEWLVENACWVSGSSTESTNVLIISILMSEACLPIVTLHCHFKEGFVEFFRVTEPESTLRTILMTLVGFAGAALILFHIV